MTQAPLLEVRGLTARYGPIVATRDVDLTVHTGEIVTLLGANGAGKTTTLTAVAGLIGSKQGQIRLDGRDVSRSPPEALVRLGVSLVPEGRRIFTGLTVAENLRIGAATRRGDRDGVAEDTERALDRFPVLRQRYRSLASALSGGEQQQLAIARGLMSKPRLLLLDEPSLGLAPKLVTAMFELIAGLRKTAELTVLLVEQNVHQALDISDRVYVLRSGAMEMSGTPDEVRRAGLERAYLGTGPDVGATGAVSPGAST